MNATNSFRSFPEADTFDVIAFDMDDTLTKAKTQVDGEMAEALCQLMQKKKVAIISGSFFPQFEKQMISLLPCSKEGHAHLENLSILPIQGAAWEEYRNGKWTEEYKEKLSEDEKKRIFSAFTNVLAENGSDGVPLYVKPSAIKGKLLEDRGGQVTFSALGQQADLADKQRWDPDHRKRERIVAALKPVLPDFTVDIGGSTSIDVTKKGIDKAYGMRQLAAHLDLPLSRIIYVGDALFPEGNDAPVLSLVPEGIRTVAVSNPEDTKKLIHSFLGSVS